MILESYMATSYSVKWLVVGWIMEFESAQGAIFLCGIGSRTALGPVHPPVNTADFISDVKATVA
jgi:hypothetical protein